jgi:hypothetical protein
MHHFGGLKNHTKSGQRFEKIKDDEESGEVAHFAYPYSTTA